MGKNKKSVQIQWNTVSPGLIISDWEPGILSWMGHLHIRRFPLQCVHVLAVHDDVLISWTVVPSTGSIVEGPQPTQESRIAAQSSWCYWMKAGCCSDATLLRTDPLLPSSLCLVSSVQAVIYLRSDGGLPRNKKSYVKMYSVGLRDWRFCACLLP